MPVALPPFGWRLEQLLVDEAAATAPSGAPSDWPSPPPRAFPAKLPAIVRTSWATGYASTLKESCGSRLPYGVYRDAPSRYWRGRGNRACGPDPRRPGSAGRSPGFLRTLCGPVFKPVNVEPEAAIGGKLTFGLTRLPFWDPRSPRRPYRRPLSLASAENQRVRAASRSNQAAAEPQTRL